MKSAASLLALAAVLLATGCERSVHDDPLEGRPTPPGAMTQKPPPPPDRDPSLPAASAVLEPPAGATAQHDGTHAPQASPGLGKEAEQQQMPSAGQANDHSNPTVGSAASAPRP